MNKVLFAILCVTSLIMNLACSRNPESPSSDPRGFASGHVQTSGSLNTGKTSTNIKEDSLTFLKYSNELKLAHKYHLENLKPRAYYYLSTIYQDAQDYKLGLIYLDSAIASSMTLKDFEWLSNSYNALGSLKIDLYDTINAKNYFDSAFEIARRNGLPRQMGMALSSRSRFEKNTEAIIKTLRSAIELLKKTPGNEEEIGKIYVNMGFYMANSDSAIEYYKKAIEIARRVKSSEVEMSAYNNMAYSYLEKNNIKEAGSCLKTYAIPLGEKLQNYDWLSTLYDSYADILLAEKKTLEAFNFERKSANMRVKADGLLATEQIRLLSTLLDFKNKEILIQKQRSEVQQKDYTIRLIYLWGSIGLLIIFTIIALYLWRQQRLKIRMQANLISSAKHLIEAEENMKGRASMELHDLVTPFYTTMIRQIDHSGINNKEIENGLKAKVSDLSQALRKLSHQMSNNFREQLALPLLLQGLCDDFMKASDIPVSFSTDGFDMRLSDEETLHLYRIVQELLTNALKYLTTGSIRISLSLDFKTLFILYDDTGPGFDMDTAGKNGIGINNIFERAKLIRGKAVLTTSPGNGTQWRITLPLNT